MATYPSFNYYKHKVYSIREGGASYDGYVIGEGIGPNGLPVYVIVGDTTGRTSAEQKRYIITAWCQYTNSTKYVFIEYKSPAYSQQTTISQMSQSDMDMAFNELSRIEQEGTTENIDEGHYTFRDLIDFKDDYGVFKSASFTNPDKVQWSEDENTVDGFYGDFQFELHDGYAVQFEQQIYQGQDSTGAQYTSEPRTYRGRDMTGTMSMSSKPLTLLSVMTPDESIDPSTGDETEDFTLRERTPTIIEDETFEGLPDSRIWMQYWPEDEDAVWPDTPAEAWQVQYDLGPDWGGDSFLPTTMNRTFDSLESAREWFDFIKSSAEGIDRQEDENTVLKSEVGTRWIFVNQAKEEQQIQGVVWRGVGPHWRIATDSVLTQEQLDEGYSTTATKYNWLGMGETPNFYSSDIGQEWRDKWNEASTDAEKIAVFDEFWGVLTAPPESEELQDTTFKGLWQRHLTVDPDNSIIEGDESGETPFRQFLLEDIDAGVSWITDNMLSVNKSAKRVSIVADSDYGFALRITPSTGTLNLGDWGEYVEGWNQELGSLVLFFEGGNGITIENGEMTIRHNKAKSVHPFITSLRTSSWPKEVQNTEAGDTYPEWQDNGDRLFFPDDDWNRDISNAIKLTLRDGWQANVDLETEDMSYFNEHFKKAGEPFTLENDKWSKELSAGDIVEMNQDNAHSGFKDGWTVKSTPSGKTSQWTYGSDTAVDDESWIGFTNMRFDKYRANEPINFEQAIVRGIYPYEFSLDDEAFTIELVQIYDAEISEDKQALEWGTTDPQDAPPETDDDDSSSGSNGGSPTFDIDSGWILGIGIVVLLFLAVRYTGGGLGE